MFDRPMTQWMPRILGRFTGHGQDRHDLFGAKGRRRPGARRIGQDRFEAVPQGRIRFLRFDDR